MREFRRKEWGRPPPPRRVEACGIFTPTEPGTTLNATISAQGTAGKNAANPARPEILREISQLTRGQFLESTDPAKILAAITALPEQLPTERRLQFWAHPLWAATLIALLTLFWIGRKAAGVF